MKYFTLLIIFVFLSKGTFADGLPDQWWLLGPEKNTSTSTAYLQTPVYSTWNTDRSQVTTITTEADASKFYLASSNIRGTTLYITFKNTVDVSNVLESFLQKHGLSNAGDTDRSATNNLDIITEFIASLEDTNLHLKDLLQIIQRYKLTLADIPTFPPSTDILIANKYLININSAGILIRTTALSPDSPADIPHYQKLIFVYNENISEDMLVLLAIIRAMLTNQEITIYLPPSSVNPNKPYGILRWDLLCSSVVGKGESVTSTQSISYNTDISHLISIAQTEGYAINVSSGVNIEDIFSLSSDITQSWSTTTTQTSGYTIGQSSTKTLMHQFTSANDNGSSLIGAYQASIVLFPNIDPNLQKSINDINTKYATYISISMPKKVTTPLFSRKYISDGEGSSSYEYSPQIIWVDRPYTPTQSLIYTNNLTTETLSNSTKGKGFSYFGGAPFTPPSTSSCL